MFASGDSGDFHRRMPDLLSSDLRTTVFWLALPVLLQQLLTFLVGFFDTFLSGRIDAVGLRTLASEPTWADWRPCCSALLVPQRWLWWHVTGAMPSTSRKIA